MILNKKEIAGFLDKLSAKYQVFAPVRQDKILNFKQINSGNEVCLDYFNTTLSPKGIFFPQSEKLFSYNTSQESVQLKDYLDEQKKVIFGIRPCDAKSLLLLDKVFDNDKYQDSYYLSKRKNTILIGIGCSNPQKTCFCTSLGSGPFDAEGLDVLLVEVGDDYVGEVITEKGKKFVSEQKLKTASKNDLKKAKEVKKKAIVSSQVQISGLKQKLDGMFYNPIWDVLCEKCLGCAICTYLCPTCHCFDIVDESRDGNGYRVRNWDSCMFPLFTLHGSGHNPRPTGKERLRQRVMHKFSYFVDNFGKVACVGCGRCIRNCPVNLDIRDVLAVIQEQKSEVQIR